MFSLPNLLQLIKSLVRQIHLASTLILCIQNGGKHLATKQVLLFKISFSFIYLVPGIFVLN